MRLSIDYVDPDARNDSIRHSLWAFSLYYNASEHATFVHNAARVCVASGARTHNNTIPAYVGVRAHAAA